jgi:hypothetical protein
MTRLLLAAVVLLAFATVTLALRGGSPARAAATKTVVLAVGDSMTVDGAPIGCQVVERDGRAVVDCRRAGRLKGTYTTLFDERRIRVARFRSSDSAKVVFTAKHRGRARRCDDDGKATRAAGKARR